MTGCQGKGDLRFNLEFGNPEAEDGVMFSAAKTADTWGFVNNLPEKWDAPVASASACRSTEP